MKQMFSILIAIVACAATAQAQANREPVVVPDAPNTFDIRADLNYSYADQGRVMFINNSAFYNKDNMIRQPIPVSNGRYTKPGNSNPINRQMNQLPPLPNPTLYNGGIPVWHAADPAESRQR